MNVLTIAMAHNESRLIRHFIRHYKRLGDVLIYDDASTDDTVSAAQTEGARVRSIEGVYPDDADMRLLWVKNTSWKSERDQYDWIIAVDADEFLYHENLIEVLRHSKEMGIPVLLPCGYEMASFEPPRDDIPITTQIRRGEFHPVYSKPCCFDPRRIDEINMWGGGHHATPSGNTWFFFPYPGLKLLHYRYLGLDWIMTRLVNQGRAYRVYPEKISRQIIELDQRAVEVLPEGPIQWFECPPDPIPPFTEPAIDWKPPMRGPRPEPIPALQGHGESRISRRPAGRWFLKQPVLPSAG